MTVIVSDIETLAEPFKAKVVRLLEAIEREGLPFLVFEARRAFSRSSALFMQGRANEDGVTIIVDRTKVVSNARAGESPHGWGLAVDCILNVDPTHPWWDGDALPKGPWDTGYDGKTLVRLAVAQAWTRYGRAVRSCDLTWGGDFVSPVDLPHAELKRWRELRPANWKEIVLREITAGR